ncbi:FdhF/YdeP family oxidoreductase [Nannocystaceae bacterium ST9]
MDGSKLAPIADPDPKATPDEPRSSALALPPASALTPLVTAPLSVEAPPKAAAGLPAVLSSLNYMLRKTGFGRGLRVLAKLNQSEGFDCPGCAWPDPSERSVVEFCENGARAVADEAMTRRIDREFFARYTVRELAERSDHWLNAQGRLTEPMILRPGEQHYRAIAWSDAFTLIADALTDLADPNEAIFYTSGRTSNEAAFLYQAFVRLFGTNNMPDCSNMCHESSGTGLKRSIGVGKGTVQLDDFLKADAIFVVGQNPGTNHPRMLSILREAKLRGVKIVSINPLREVGLIRFKHPQMVGDLLGSGVELTDLYLQVKINGDVALLKAIMKCVLEAEAAAPGTVIDRAFIDEHTIGYQAVIDELDRHAFADLVEACGVPEDQIRAAAKIYVESKATIACWAMGLTQHQNGVGNIQELTNLLLLKGNLGRPGAGVCPVRGHSNVQGDRTMGIWERPSEAFLDRVGKAIGFEPPRAHGFDVIEAIEAMHEGRGKLFFALGGNFLSATPDTDFTAEALRRCPLTVQVSTKLNRSHLVTGETALILPCLGRTERDVQAGVEQFVTVENSMGIVHRSRGGLEPASPHLLSEPMIVARLAAATLGARSPIDFVALATDYDRIRDLIEQAIAGFDDYNRRVRDKDGFLLPNGARERKWATGSGKAEFIVNAVPEWKLADDELLMMTIRTHDQYNTTIYDLDDRYRGIHGYRRVVMMNPKDLRRFGIDPYDQVDLTSRFAGKERHAPRWVAIPYDIPPGMCATHFPEANVLVPVEQFAEGSRTPASKSVVVTLRKAVGVAPRPKDDD